MYVIKSNFKDNKTNITQQIYFIKFKRKKIFNKFIKIRYCTENINCARIFDDFELEKAQMICRELSDNFSVYPICPICGYDYEDPPAISRIDNITPICSKCGFNEAIASFYKK